MIHERTIARAFGNRDAAKRVLDASFAEEHLIDYIRLMWPILHPEVELIEGRALDALCDHIEAMSRGKISKLIINVPPGCMKSLSTGVFAPTWEWGPCNRPDLDFISASYEQGLAERRNDLIIRLIESDLYQSLWGDRFQLVKQGSTYITNDRSGSVTASSVGGSLTGKRADRIIIDDPIKAEEAESEVVLRATIRWFFGTASTRTNSKAATFLLIMQRLHGQDLTGHILDHGLPWEHLCLPMRRELDHPFPSRTSLGFQDWRGANELLWPELFDEERVDELEEGFRSEGGEFYVSGQHQQRPTPRGGGLFQHKDFQYIDEVPDLSQVVRGWDLAATKDGAAAFTVGVKMARTVRDDIVILDVRRIQGTPGEVESLLLECAESDGVGVPQDIPQDPGQAGKAQKRSLAKLLQGYTTHFSPETGSKEDRARPLAAQAEGGNLYILKAPWNDAFVAEATTFPRGRWKDQVDAASRAYTRLVMKKGPTIGMVPPVLVG